MTPHSVFKGLALAIAWAPLSMCVYLGFFFVWQWEYSLRAIMEALDARSWTSSNIPSAVLSSK